MGVEISFACIVGTSWCVMAAWHYWRGHVVPFTWASLWVIALAPVWLIVALFLLKELP